jgi:hypothetical protein
MTISVEDLHLAHRDDDGLTKLVVQDAAKVVIHVWWRERDIGHYNSALVWVLVLGLIVGLIPSPVDDNDPTTIRVGPIDADGNPDVPLPPSVHGSLSRPMTAQNLTRRRDLDLVARHKRNGLSEASEARSLGNGYLAGAPTEDDEQHDEDHEDDRDDCHDDLAGLPSHVVRLARKRHVCAPSPPREDGLIRAPNLSDTRQRDGSHS